MLDIFIALALQTASQFSISAVVPVVCEAIDTFLYCNAPVSYTIYVVGPDGRRPVATGVGPKVEEIDHELKSGERFQVEFWA